MEKTIKIAVVVFGHLRTFRKCLDSVRNNLLSQYDCDVYMHTWDKTEACTPATYSEQLKSPCLSVTDDDLNFIKETINPIDITIDKQINSKDNPYIKAQHNLEGKVYINSFKNMIVSFYKAVEQCKISGKLYDLVISVRPDIKLLKKLKIEDLFKELNVSEFFNNNRFCAYRNDKAMGERNLSIDFASDIIQIAKPEVMFKIADILKDTNIENYENSCWTPETLETKILQDNKIFTHSINYIFDRDWKIVRGGSYKSKNTLKRIIRSIIRLRIRENKFHLGLFEGFLFEFFSIHLVLFKFFKIDINIGA